ncbi:hypothetical protein GCM10007916_24700 [Psychromonas marina]|uniref:Uncharacterized protein n=1 Tax=Psychromonas marina TaxID=88364 RepID=A0ABQ6E211_9GAMM|nr:hypothetical protein GCM10007916_24700 [Psychromonas marina]
MSFYIFIISVEKVTCTDLFYTILKRIFVMARTTGRKRFWFQQTRDQKSETKITIKQTQQLIK